jgi:hypothetical protein
LLIAFLKGETGSQLCRVQPHLYPVPLGHGLTRKDGHAHQARVVEGVDVHSNLKSVEIRKPLHFVHGTGQINSVLNQFYSAFSNL